MVDFSAIASGVGEQIDFRRGQRQQMAEAFAKFKASNPMATVADFQNFIDSFSGGNNYIAGGAPGESVLKRIAASNQAREAERKRNVAMANYSQELEFIKQLTPRINTALLGTSNFKHPNESGLDFESSYKTFMDQNPDIKKLDINIKDLFSPWKYNKIKSDMFAERSPQAYAYLENAEDPENIDVSQFSRLYTDGNETLAKELLGIQKKKFNKVQTEKLNAEIEKYSEKFNTLINTKNANGQYNTPAEAQAIIESQMKNSPFYGKLKEGDWLKETFDAGEDRAAQRINAEKATELRDLKSHLGKENVEKIIENMIATKGKEAAKKYILDQFKDMVASKGWDDPAGKVELEKFLDNHLETAISERSHVQDASEWERKQKLQEQLKENLTQMREENQTAADGLFSGSEAGKLANQIASVPTIVKNLGSKWFMDNTTKNLILTFSQNQENADVGKDVQALQDSLDTFLADNGATPLSSAIQQATETAGLRPLSRTTFTDYRSELETHINNNQTSIMKEATKIVDDLSGSQDKAEYESAIRVLNGLKSQYGNWTGGLGRTIQRNFDDRFAWRDISGKLYDKGVIDNLLANAEGFSLEDIDEMVDNLKTQAENLESSGQDGNKRAVEDPRSQDDQGTDELRADGAFRNNKPKYLGIPLDAMDSQIPTLTRSFKTWGHLNNAQSAIQRHLEQFFKHDRPRNMWREYGLEQEGFKYSDFIDDPLDFMLTNPEASKMAKGIFGDETFRLLGELANRL